MSTQSYRFGASTTSRSCSDGTFEGIDHAHRAARPRAPRQSSCFGQPKISIDVNCFRRAARTASRLSTPASAPPGAGLRHARAALVAAGIGTEQVERVLMTHLHGDHALGLFDGEEPWLRRPRSYRPAGSISPITAMRLVARGDAEGPAGRFDIAVTFAAALCRPPGQSRSLGTVLPGIELLPLPGPLRV